MFKKIIWMLICHTIRFFFPDPIYAVSSERDHARATFKAHTGIDRVVSIPC